MGNPTGGSLYQQLINQDRAQFRNLVRWDGRSQHRDSPTLNHRITPSLGGTSEGPRMAVIFVCGPQCAWWQWLLSLLPSSDSALLLWLLCLLAASQNKTSACYCHNRGRKIQGSTCETSVAFFSLI